MPAPCWLRALAMPGARDSDAPAACAPAPADPAMHAQLRLPAASALCSTAAGGLTFGESERGEVED
jgi:hypothetical protein